MQAECITLPARKCQRKGNPYAHKPELREDCPNPARKKWCSERCAEISYYSPQPRLKKKCQRKGDPNARALDLRKDCPNVFKPINSNQDFCSIRCRAKSRKKTPAPRRVMCQRKGYLSAHALDLREDCRKMFKAVRSTQRHCSERCRNTEAYYSRLDERRGKAKASAAELRKKAALEKRHTKDTGFRITLAAHLFTVDPDATPNYGMARRIFPKQNAMPLAYDATVKFLNRHRKAIDTEKRRLLSFSESARHLEAENARSQLAS